jgi:hypothetical protein
LAVVQVLVLLPATVVVVTAVAASAEAANASIADVQLAKAARDRGVGIRGLRVLDRQRQPVLVAEEALGDAELGLTRPGEAWHVAGVDGHRVVDAQRVDADLGHGQQRPGLTGQDLEAEVAAVVGRPGLHKARDVGVALVRVRGRRGTLEIGLHESLDVGDLVWMALDQGLQGRAAGALAEFRLVVELAVAVGDAGREAGGDVGHLVAGPEDRGTFDEAAKGDVEIADRECAERQFARRRRLGPGKNHGTGRRAGRRRNEGIAGRDLRHDGRHLGHRRGGRTGRPQFTVALGGLLFHMAQLGLECLDLLLDRAELRVRCLSLGESGAGRREGQRRCQQQRWAREAESHGEISVCVWATARSGHLAVGP